MPTVETCQSLGRKTVTLAGDVTIAAAEFPANRRQTGALGQQHNTLGGAALGGPTPGIYAARHTRLSNFEESLNQPILLGRIGCDELLL